MSQPHRSGAGAVAVGARAVYDAVAREYDSQQRDEIDSKPLDRALLQAFAELAGKGTIADVGCGPGRITRFLAARHPEVLGIDLSPGMIALARQQAPELSFTVGSMLELPAADGAWAGAIAFYSIIHLNTQERARAFSELGRVVRGGGWVLVAFHVDSPDYAAGQINHLTSWFGKDVDLDAHFLDPAEVTAQLESASFAVTSRTDRQPVADAEYPSRRCYLLARRS